jgi:hypothetical protein
MALRRRIHAIKSAVNRVLVMDFGCKPLHGIRRKDELRLLTLWVWSTKYKVSIRYMLQVLLPIWRKRFKTEGSRGMGCKVPLLVGVASNRILLEAIVRDYPDNANLTDWALREKLRIRGITESGALRKVGRLDPVAPEAFAARYRKVILHRSKQVERAVSSKIYRRAYRDNPWRM